MLTLLTLVDEWKAVVPASLLSFSMVPFATISLTICPVQIVSKTLYRKLDNALYSAYMRLCLFVFENISSVQIVLYGDIDEVLSREEKVLVLSNHQSNVDWAVINMLAARQTPKGSEKGLRFVVKNAIKYHGYVYVRRFGRFVSDPVKRQLAFLESLEAPMWLLIFPEGTRFCADKPKLLQDANAFQKARGLPITRHVLAPKTGGIQLALEGLPSLDAVYDVTIAYGQTRFTGREGRAPQMFSFVCGPHDGKTVHVHLRRHPASTVPQDKLALSAWIADSYKRKDELLEQFVQKGEFDDASHRAIPSLSIWKTLPPTVFFVSALVAPFFVPKVRKAYVLTCLSSPLLILWLTIRKCA